MCNSTANAVDNKNPGINTLEILPKTVRHALVNVFVEFEDSAHLENFLKHLKCRMIHNQTLSLSVIFVIWFIHSYHRRNLRHLVYPRKKCGTSSFLDIITLKKNTMIKVLHKHGCCLEFQQVHFDVNWL